jgi:hypothetical protein
MRPVDGLAIDERCIDRAGGADRQLLGRGLIVLDELCRDFLQRVLDIHGRKPGVGRVELHLCRRLIVRLAVLALRPDKARKPLDLGSDEAVLDGDFVSGRAGRAVDAGKPVVLAADEASLDGRLVGGLPVLAVRARAATQAARDLDRNGGDVQSHRVGTSSISRSTRSSSALR